MADSEIKSSGLTLKIAQIMGELKRIPKEGRNDYQKYDYVTEGDVADLIREKLAARNIAFFASMTRWHQEPAGDKNIKTVCDFEYRFVDADSGESITLTWSGEANDTQDKGMSKAATSAEKYFLLKTFMLSTGKKSADPDSGPRPQQERRQNAPQPAQNAQKPAAPVVVPDARKQALMEAFDSPDYRCRDFYSMYPDEADKKRTFAADVTILEEAGKLPVGCTDAKMISTAIHFDMLSPKEKAKAS